MGAINWVKSLGPKAAAKLGLGAAEKAFAELSAKIAEKLAAEALEKKTATELAEVAVKDAEVALKNANAFKVAEAQKALKNAKEAEKLAKEAQVTAAEKAKEIEKIIADRQLTAEAKKAAIQKAWGRTKTGAKVAAIGTLAYKATFPEQQKGIVEQFTEAVSPKDGSAPKIGYGSAIGLGIGALLGALAAPFLGAAGAVVAVVAAIIGAVFGQPVWNETMKDNAQAGGNSVPAGATPNNPTAGQQRGNDPAVTVPNIPKNAQSAIKTQTQQSPVPF